MNKILTKTLLCGLTLSNLLSPVLNAQINPTVPNTTSDHQKQCIGYITQWDHWKGASNKVTPHSYNHLNINYSQYTILNFSFFGVAVDGSLHSADYRNKQIYQPNEVQAPNPLVYEDIYSSYDWFFFKGDVQYYWNWDPFLSTLGYTFNSSTQMWTNTNTGETGSFANGLIETKQNAAFKGIFEIAHSHGVKVMASIGGWSMCKHFKEVAADATKKAKFIADVKKLIKMGFDGIDIDWEYPGRTGMNFTGTQADFNNFAQLMEDIRQAIGNTKLLSACFHSVVKANEFDWNRLNNCMNYFNFMTYDLNGGWSNKAGHNAPLFDYPNAEYAGLSLNATLDSIKKLGINQSKVNLGGAFYGRGVVCNGPAELNVPTVKTNVTILPDGPVSSAADLDNFKLDVWDGTPNYSYILSDAGTANGWTEKWDANAMVPYRIKGNYFLSYDNTQSLGCKAQFIKDNNLAGIIIWQVYGDLIGLNSGCNSNKLPFCPGTTSPLINEINRVFASPTRVCQFTNSIETNLIQNNTIAVSPIPSSGKVQVDLGNVKTKTQITIHNMIGEEVYKTVTEQDVILDLGHLSKGIYILQTQSGLGKGSSKIILE